MKIKLFISDVDGTLTDGTVYYSEKGEELKQFSHKDGRAFHLLRHESECKTAWLTSENGGINAARAGKLIKLGTLDYFGDNIHGKGKLGKAMYICEQLNIDIENVAFIGDDTNDSELLKKVGVAACPNNANKKVKELDGILVMENNGGDGAVREFVDILFDKKYLDI